MFPSECREAEPIYWRDDIEPDVVCPVLLVPEYEDFITAYTFYEKSIMPHAVGWIEQPRYWVDAIEIVRDQVGKAAQLIRERIKEQHGDSGRQ